MKIEEYLTEVGHYADLTPQEQSIVFDAAAMIVYLRNELKWARVAMNSGFARERALIDMLYRNLGANREENDGTDSRVRG